MAPGIWQIALVVLLVLVVFGAGRIPSIMENMAKGINSFKKGLKDEDRAIKDAQSDDDLKPQSETVKKENDGDKAA